MTVHCYAFSIIVLKADNGWRATCLETGESHVYTTSAYDAVVQISTLSYAQASRGQTSRHADLDDCLSFIEAVVRGRPVDLTTDEIKEGAAVFAWAFPTLPTTPDDGFSPYIIVKQMAFVHDDAVLSRTRQKDMLEQSSKEDLLNALLLVSDEHLGREADDKRVEIYAIEILNMVRAQRGEKLPIQTR